MTFSMHRVRTWRPKTRHCLDTTYRGGSGIASFPNPFPKFTARPNLSAVLPLAVLLSAFGLPPSAQSAAPRPNILFIALDDLNDWVGCLGGHPQARTPNIDRLARSGVLFENAHCAAPACNPSRTAIFTGLAPNRSGLYDNRQKMREILPNTELLPKYFARHGYWAGGSGKMLHYFIDARSWDEYYPKKETENPFPPHIKWGKRPKSLPHAGPWMYVETDWHAFDVTDDEFGGDAKVADWVSGQLSRDHDRPFFLACGIYRPHEPWFVPKKYFDMFPLDEVQMPPGLKDDDLDDLPPAGKRRGPNRYLAHIKKHGQWRQGIQAYLASIAYADAMLGRVLDALNKSPHRDNTIVVLWSDHGWHLGEKQHWQKFTGWRVCTRVPLIIHVPSGAPGLPEGSANGRRCSRPVSLISLFATLTELAGLPNKPGIDGPSLVPLLRDPSTDWQSLATTFLNTPNAYAVSGERWRYIHYDDGGEELYDISSDPFEFNNLANTPRHASVLEGMRARSPRDFKPKTMPVRASQPQKGPPKRVLRWRQAGPKTTVQRKTNSTGAGSSIVFINQRDAPVKLWWVDGSGERKPYGQIRAKSPRELKTFGGHVWLVTDASDAPLGSFIAEDENARAIIPPPR